MTDGPDPQAELARLIAGEVDPASPEGRDILERSGLAPEKLDELEALRALAGELESAAEFRRAVETHARDLTDVPGLERAREALRHAELPGEARPTGAPRPRASDRLRRALDWLLPLAALALVVPLLVHLWNGGEPRRERLSSDGEGVVIESPIGGPWQPYPPVEWRVTEPRIGDEVRLFVFDDEDELRVEPLFEHVLKASPWSDPEEQARWPDAVFLRIEVERLVPDDRPAAWARAWRTR